MAAYIQALRSGSDDVYPVTRAAAVYTASNVNAETAINGKIDTNKIITNKDTLLATTATGYLADASLIPSLYQDAYNTGKEDGLPPSSVSLTYNVNNTGTDNSMGRATIPSSLTKMFTRYTTNVSATGASGGAYVTGTLDDGLAIRMSTYDANKNHQCDLTVTLIRD